MEQGAVRKVWRQCVRAEQQTELLRTLKTKKVGTSDIEEHMKKQMNTRKIRKNRKRNVNLIIMSMEGKCQDAASVEAAARKKKAAVRRKMEKSMGKNSSKLRNTIRNLKKEAAGEKVKMKVKNRNKIKHLEEKYIKKDEGIPESLKKYQEAAIFSGADIKALHKKKLQFMEKFQ